MSSKSLALFPEMGEGITHGAPEIWVTPAKGWSSFKMRKIAPETDRKGGDQQRLATTPRILQIDDPAYSASFLDRSRSGKRQSHSLKVQHR